MDPFSQTTTVLTLDLPSRIDERLRRALRAENRSARDVTLEALELWLDQYEAAESSSEGHETESPAPAASAAPRT